MLVAPSAGVSQSANRRSPPPLWEAPAVTPLTACGKTHTAFDRRCIPPEPLRFAPFFVAFRSKYTRYSSLTRLVSRAPHRSRRSRGFHHRLLTACGKTHPAQFSRWGLDRRCIPPEPLRFAPPPGELAGLGAHAGSTSGCQSAPHAHKPPDSARGTSWNSCGVLSPRAANQAISSSSGW